MKIWAGMENESEGLSVVPGLVIVLLKVALVLPQSLGRNLTRSQGRVMNALVVPDVMLSHVDARIGSHQQFRNSGKLLMLVPDVYLFFSLNLHIFAEEVFLVPIGLVVSAKEEVVESSSDHEYVIRTVIPQE